MKVGIYIPTASFFVGGGEVVPMMQAKYLQKYGIDVTVILLETEKETSFLKDFKNRNSEIKYHYLKTPKNFQRFDERELTHPVAHEMYFGLSKEVSTYFLKEMFDVVITHYGPATFSVPEGVKQLYLLHGVPPNWDSIGHASVRIAEKVAAVSVSTANGWSEKFDFKDIQVLHNGIENEKFFPNKMKEDIDIFYVGRLIEIKGIQYLIDSISLLQERGFDNLKVVIGGKGPFEDVLREQVRINNLEERITFQGYIPDDQLVDFYRKSKVCVFPSYAREGVLTTMLEAASTGRAIVTTNSCGMVDFLEHGHNGLLAEPENSIDLADKIEQFLLSDNLRTKLGENARKDICKSWTWDQKIQSMINILKSM